MTDAHQRARLEHIALAGRRAHLELRIAEQRMVVRHASLPAGDLHDLRQRIAEQTAVLRCFEIELRKVRTEESQSLVNLRRIKQRADNPRAPGAPVSLRPPPLPGPRDHIDLPYCEAARRWVWEVRPYRDYRGPDYDREARTFPSDPDGVCRHKSAWLAKLLGGRVLLGRRTDEPDAGPHAVASVKINGAAWVLDHDKTWLAADAPFRVEEFAWR